MTQRLISMIRKYASVLALAAVLCACVAAPYLVPADPDSPVFRVGTLGALMLLFERMKASGFTHAVVQIEDVNAASLALHTALGFTKSSVNGRIVTMEKDI